MASNFGSRGGRGWYRKEKTIKKMRNSRKIYRRGQEESIFSSRRRNPFEMPWHCDRPYKSKRRLSFCPRNDSHSTEGQVVLRRCLYPTRDPKKGSTELTDMMVVGAMRATIVYLLCEKIGLGEHDPKKKPRYCNRSK